MIRISQQRQKCIGCNACIEAARYRWRISRKDGRSTLVGGKEKRGIFHFITGNDELEDNIQAARHCPVNIIKVERIKG
ncbi:MAG: ferredoxin [Bacteroidia bacterium]